MDGVDVVVSQETTSLVLLAIETHFSTSFIQIAREMKISDKPLRELSARDLWHEPIGGKKQNFRDLRASFPQKQTDLETDLCLGAMTSPPRHRLCRESN